MSAWSRAVKFECVAAARGVKIRIFANGPDSMDVKAKFANEKYKLAQLRNTLDSRKEYLNNLLGRDIRTGERSSGKDHKLCVRSGLARGGLLRTTFGLRLCRGDYGGRQDVNALFGLLCASGFAPGQRARRDRRDHQMSGTHATCPGPALIFPGGRLR